MPPYVKTYVYYCLLNRATQIVEFLGIIKWLYLGFIGLLGLSKDEGQFKIFARNAHIIILALTSQ